MLLLYLGFFAVFLTISTSIALIHMRLGINPYMSKREYILPVGIVSTVLTVLIFIINIIISGFNSSNSEIRSGLVTGKEREYVSCRHSYECMCVNICTTDGKGNQTCQKVCQTCYEHTNDWDYPVYTTIGTYEIDTIDRRGINIPPRWAKVNVGDPVADKFRYKDFIRGSKSQLFSTQSFTDEDLTGIPGYPKVYDYYHTKRVIDYANTGLDSEMNRYLDNYLGLNAKSKQLNIIAVIYRSYPPSSFEKFLFKAEAPKKNDVVVVMSIDSDNKIEWLKSTSFANGFKNNELHANMSFTYTGEKLDLKSFYSMVGMIGERFNRVPMEEFRYLEEAATKETGLTSFAVILILFLLVCSVVTVIEIRQRKSIRGNVNAKRYW